MRTCPQFLRIMQEKGAATSSHCPIEVSVYGLTTTLIVLEYGCFKP